MTRTTTTRAREAGLLALASLGLLLVALAVHARPAATSGPPVLNRVAVPRSNPPRQAGASSDFGNRAPHGWNWHLPIVLLLQILLWSAIAAGLFFLARRRLRRWGSRSATANAAPPPADYAIEDSLADLGAAVTRTFDSTWSRVRGGDARAAIIACWSRLEEIAEGAGFVRLSADTSTELAARMLSRLPLDTAALDELAALYREARFSSHPMSTTAIERARRTLGRLGTQLPVATTGNGDG